MLNDDIIMMHGDLVFEKSVFEDVIKSEHSCMTVSSSLPLPEKDFKAVIDGDRIKAVGVEFFESALADFYAFGGFFLAFDGRNEKFGMLFCLGVAAVASDDGTTDVKPTGGDHKHSYWANWEKDAYKSPSPS